MLKLVNCMIGMVGLSMIMFIYTFLGLGITLLVTTCSGHIAAATKNGCCLYLVSFCFKYLYLAFHQKRSGRLLYCIADLSVEVDYMVFVFLLFMLEAGVTAHIFLNRDWEEDFPVDPTGRFDQFKEFVRSNLDNCKWIGLSIACVQVSLNFLFLYCMFVHACLRKLKGKSTPMPLKLRPMSPVADKT
ncbi:hypothetical protein DVH24_035234 [Malus domestica]|uniref:Uncharacterized protein n=1 Tax=Malus domestica TaxID=3750 RepID=A0A498J4P8_MALDO|nr:hypothetical protein DVH24_035234 [Malus domestica]